MTSSAIVLVLITLVAATVNGALGYGFSSITVPLALLFYTNLTPALVAVEVPLNAYVLWVNRRSVPQVWRRVVPIVVGLALGVVVGTALVHRVQPGWLKLGTFIVLLPLILLQGAGIRRPLGAERSIGRVFGSGLGILYAVTRFRARPSPWC